MTASSICLTLLLVSAAPSQRVEPAPAVVTPGNHDGVHLGHRALVSTAARVAAREQPAHRGKAERSFAVESVREPHRTALRTRLEAEPFDRAFVIPGSLRRKVAFRDGYRCYVREDHPRLSGVKRLGRRLFAELDHVLVSFTGGGPGVVDRALAEAGLERREPGTMIVRG